MRLVEKTSHHRIYELDFTVHRFWDGSKMVHLSELFAGDPPRLKDEYEFAQSLDSVNTICVSDAHTHIERLVFPAIKVRHIASGRELYTPIMHTICGRHTSMIDGGNHRYVYRDETYVRLLRKWNLADEEAVK